MKTILQSFFQTTLHTIIAVGFAATISADAAATKKLLDATTGTLVTGNAFCNLGGIDGTTYGKTYLNAEAKYASNNQVISFTVSVATLSDSSYWISVGGDFTFNTATGTTGVEIRPGESKVLPVGTAISNADLTKGKPSIPFQYQYFKAKTSSSSQGTSTTTGGTSTGGTTTSGGTSAKPVINVTANAGQSFGTITQRGATKDLIFKVSNTGNANLVLSGSPLVRLSGTDAAQFSVPIQPAGTISAGGSSSFTIRYAPTATGTHNATVTITSNDPSKPTCTFSITGIANLPTAEIGYFEWSYNGSLRVWQRSGTVWTERSPNGSVETFDTVSKVTLAVVRNGVTTKNPATLVRSRSDNKKEIIIPDLAFVSDGLWYRYNGGAWGCLATTLKNCR